MELKLHQLCTSDEAIAAFAPDESLEIYCEGTFHVGSRTILCFITIDEQVSTSAFETPSRFTFRPLRRELSEHVNWLASTPRDAERIRWQIANPEVPASIRPRAKSTQPDPPPKQRYVFFRRPSERRFLYAGPAHMGSYQMTLLPTGTVLELANFSLKSRLSRADWLRFGGYAEWNIVLDHKAHQLSRIDLPAFESLLAACSAAEYGHLLMTRYEEDSLQFHKNSRRGWFLYLREPADGGICLKNTDGSPDVQEDFRCTCGIDLEVSADTTLPLDQSCEVLRQFFRTGELDKRYQWMDQLNRLDRPAG